MSVLYHPFLKEGQQRWRIVRSGEQRKQSLTLTLLCELASAGVYGGTGSPKAGAILVKECRPLGQFGQEFHPSPITSPLFIKTIKYHRRRMLCFKN